MRCIEAPWGGGLYAQTVDLRYGVLRNPLGLWFSPEELMAEKSDRHFAILSGKQVVACLVASPLSDTKVKLRQMAVEPEMQRQGLGTKLVAFTESALSAIGFQEAVLHARQGAVGFYQRLGYRVVGEPFVEVGLSHRAMHKTLIRL